MFRAQNVWEILPSSMGCEVQPPAAALNMGDSAQCHRGKPAGVYYQHCWPVGMGQLWVRNPHCRAKCANSN